MFKKFFIKDEEDEEMFETVDPVLEQRRKEKFSAPLIYNDDVEEEKKKEEVKKKEPVKKTQPVESTYRMSEIISPMSGIKQTFETEVKVKKPKKKKIKKENDVVIFDFFHHFLSIIYIILIIFIIHLFHLFAA